MIERVFRFKTTRETVDSHVDILKVIISLCSVFIGGLVFKGAPEFPAPYLKTSVLFAVISCICCIGASVKLAEFKSSNLEKPSYAVSFYFLLGWISFLVAIGGLGLGIVLY